MEKVKVTFELSKDFISSVMTIMKLTPKDPADKDRLLEEIDDNVIDADDDEVFGEGAGEMKLALALIAIGKTAQKLDIK